MRRGRGRKLSCMAAKDDLGRAGEERAVAHVRELGYDVLDRNWRCAQGELDIVARHRDTLVVIEVKARRTIGFGHPFEAIDARKRRRLWGLAFAWAAAHPEQARGRGLRLDAIAIIGDNPHTGSLEHLENLT